MKIAYSFLLIVIFSPTEGFLCAADPDPENKKDEVERLIKDHVRPAVTKLDHEEERDKEEALADKINAAAWRLMLGEILTIDTPSLSLWTTAVDALEDGIAGLKELDDVDKTSLNKLTDEHKAELLKFDILNGRRKELQEGLALARDMEWKRINDMRKLATSYKKLVDLLAMQTYFDVSGNTEKSREYLKLAEEHSENIASIIDDTKDYYLFEDEVKDAERPNDAPSYDIKIKLESTPPFATPLIQNLKASQALSLWNIATGNSRLTNNIPSKEKKLQLLDRATEIAKSVLADDPENPVALLAAARSQRDRALDAINESPHQLHKKEHKEMADSVSKLKRARHKLINGIKGGAVDRQIEEDGAVDRQIEIEIEALTKPDEIIKNAQELTLGGHPLLAYKILQDAKGAHRSSDELWKTLYSVGVNLGINTSALYDDFNLAKENNILKKDTAEIILLDAFVFGGYCWELLCTNKVENIKPGKRKELLKEIGMKRDALNKLSTNPKATPVTRAQAGANVSYLSYLEELLQAPAKGPKQPNLARNNRIGRIFQDTLPVLTDAINSNPDPWQVLRLTHSLTRLCFSYAYMASKHIPTYNPDAMVAYAAGYDLLARLPTNQTKHLRGLGTPLLNGIQVYKNRSDEDTKNLNLQEKDRRLELGRFVEAMYVSHFGDKQAALELLQKNKKQAPDLNNNPVSVEAVDQLPLLSGFTDTVDHQTAIRSFTLLALVEAGKHEEALDDLLSLLSGPHQNPPAPIDIKRAVETVDEPLIAFALSRALHAKIQSYRIFDSTPDRVTNIENIKELYERLLNLTNTSAFYAKRYPHLASQSTQQRALYDDTNIFIGSLDEASTQGNLRRVRTEAEEGLRYHPTSKPMWIKYLDSSIELISRGQIPPKLPDLTIAIDVGAVPGIQKTYYEAIINEAQGDLVKARNLYQVTANISKIGVGKDKALTRLHIQSESKAIELSLN